MTRVLVAGATSAVAQAAARRFAAQGATLFLAGRNAGRLEAVAADLRVRGARDVATFVIDLADLSRHEDLFETATSRLGGLDAVLVAHGLLPDQAACEADPTIAAHAIHTNFTSAAAILAIAARHLERERGGCIAAITSVAGDRGRRTNYVYGAAKGGLTIFLEGMRHRLAPAGVAIVTIKPGLVDSPMTAHLPKNPLYASPEAVGAAVHRAMLRRRSVVYAPWFWRWIMLVVRLLPGQLLRRLPL